jgi:hypothetical protein
VFIIIALILGLLILAIKNLRIHDWEAQEWKNMP